MNVQRIIIPYSPRPAFLPYHNRKQRFAAIVAHRRAGKTVGCINDIIKRAVVDNKPDARYAYIAPLFNQAKDVAWTYLKQYAAPLLASQPNETELRVDLLNGARVRLYGADNPDRLRGIYLDGCVLDEYADMQPAVWGQVVRPALADRQGWATFIGTPKGRNAFHDIFSRAQNSPDWFAMILRASETGLLPASELELARVDMTPEQYEQEFECSFDAAITGAYYGKELAQAERDGRITRVEYDANLPVHTVWDLGVSDSTVIWFFQVMGGEIRVIDHYENHGQGLPHYAGVINAKPYKYAEHWVPHDARVRELGTGRTRIETMIALGFKVPRLVPDHKVMDGINAARLTIERCWFDADRCKDGLEALRQYQTEYDEKTRSFKDTPKHDWTSHSADGFRYLAMAWREIAGESKPRDPIKQLMKPRTISEVVGEIGEPEWIDG